MDVKKVGASIRFLRRQEGYTQQEFADFLGVTYQAVSKWERGLCLPDATFHARLAEKLNVELEDLLEGNITYREHSWEGVLYLAKEPDFDLPSRLYDIMLSYFMLAGIKRVKVCAIEPWLDAWEKRFEDGSRYGLEIRYDAVECDAASQDASNGAMGAMPSAVFDDIHPEDGILLVTDIAFFYGTNLTKYFWNGMAHYKCPAVLTAPSGEAMPIMFVAPHHRKQWLADRSAATISMARGILYSVITDAATCQDVMHLIDLIEALQQERLYDLAEIAKARFLN